MYIIYLGTLFPCLNDECFILNDECFIGSVHLAESQVKLLMHQRFVDISKSWFTYLDIYKLVYISQFLSTYSE